MEFGILFTSHPDKEREPYPHRDVHARTTREIIEADRLRFDIAWIAEEVMPAFRDKAAATAAAE